MGSPSKLLNSVWCFRLYTIYYSQWWLPVHKITWPVLVNCDQVTLLEIESQFKWLLTSGEFCREPKPWLFPGSSPDQAVFFPHCPLFCSLFFFRLIFLGKSSEYCERMVVSSPFINVFQHWSFCQVSFIICILYSHINRKRKKKGCTHSICLTWQNLLDMVMHWLQFSHHFLG